MNFTQAVGWHWVEEQKTKVWDWEHVGEGSENPWWKNPVHILCCVQSPSLSQLGLVRPGPALSTAPSHSSGRQMHGRWRDDVAWGSSYFLLLLVKFKQQHDCIISSAYMTRTRLGPLRCPETHIVFVVLLVFSSCFFQKNKDKRVLKMFDRNQNQTED